RPTVGLPPEGRLRAARRQADRGERDARTEPARRREQARQPEHHPDHRRRGPGQDQRQGADGRADYQNLTPPAEIDARYLWQADDGEIIIVRNGGTFGSLSPSFEARVDGPYAYLNDGRYLSSNPGVGQGGVAL